MSFVNEKYYLPAKYPVLFFTLTSLLFVINVLVISTDKWVRIVFRSEEEYIGLYYTTSDVIFLGCNTDTSVTECGYLLSARSSGFLGMFFMTCTTIGYYHIATNFQKYAIPGFWWTVTAVLGFLASVFSIICLILYYYFKTSYLQTNDDLNIEYATNDRITTSEFEWSFWTFTASVLINTLISFANVSLNIDSIRRYLKIQPHLASQKF
jgi:hypothetical protein